MSTVKDLKKILDGYEKSNPVTFANTVADLTMDLRKSYSKFLKADLEKLIGMLGPGTIKVPTRRSSSVGKSKTPKKRSSSSSPKKRSKSKTPKKRSSSRTPSKSARGPCHDKTGKYKCDDDEYCNTSQKKCVPSSFKTNKTHRFVVDENGKVYVGSQATIEAVCDQLGLSRRLICDSKNEAVAKAKAISPSPRKRSDSQATIKLKTPTPKKSPSPTMKIPTPKKSPGFPKCGDDFLKGKYCEDDKPYCNVKTGNCTKILPKSAARFSRNDRTVYAPDEEIVKRFERHYADLTRRSSSRGRSRSRSASKSRSKSRSRSASKKRSSSKSRSRSRSQSRPKSSPKKYTMKGCQSYTHPGCPPATPYCSSSGACVKTQVGGGTYIELNGKKIYGKTDTLEKLMKSVNADVPIRTGKSPAKRSSSKGKSPAKRSSSKGKSPAKASMRRNTPVPSGSWAKGCYAPGAADCDTNEYCGASGNCIKTKGTYVLKIGDKKVYGTTDALTKLAKSAGIDPGSIQKSKDYKSPAKRSSSKGASPAKRSSSKGKSPAKRSSSTARVSPAKKSSSRKGEVTDAEIISAFNRCIAGK